jgi:hypothetical protein
MDNPSLLANLIANPEKVLPAHIPMLKNMAEQFPYAQPIHFLLAKADEKYLSKAALYGNPYALQQIINLKPSEDLLIEDDEVYDEIAELNPISSNDLSELEKNGNDQSANNSEASIDDNLFIESAISTDFFSFEQALSTDVVKAPEIETVVPDGIDVNFVSKYDDDQLPYSFLWWLAKTRKEHEQIFQPYASPKPTVSKQHKNTQDPGFQQQYVEHIFHIQTPFDVADHLAEFPLSEAKDAKGAEIIEKFLKEDPTIKPPKPEQIDNENKAKKSAEDHYDLVSETLAKIYIEQMLYHKAIDTYKKLSLKFPEKSRYFADLIQSIEKKL